MDVGLLVMINVVVFSTLAALMTAMSRTPGQAAWISANLAVVATAGLLVWLRVPFAPWMTLAVFAILVAMPLALILLGRRRAIASDMAGAARLMRLATLFAPSRANRFQARIMEALAATDRDAAARALDQLATEAPDEQSRTLAIGHAARARDDWSGLADIARAPATIPIDLLPFAVRALGETGAIDDMIRVYAATRDTARPDAVAALDLFALAFAGRPDGVAAILAGPLGSIDEEARRFWQAVAHLAADPADIAARAELQDLGRRGKGPVRHAAARHAATLRKPLDISADAEAIIATAASRAGRAPARSRRGLLRSWATLSLLAAIAGTYIYSEYAGGSDDISVLFRLGAAEAQRVLVYGDWWRLVAALFLHYGIAHVFANTVMLGLLGPVVERRYGGPAVLATFFVGGIGSMLAVVLMMQRGIVEHGIVVGASGAVFALIGFEGARRFLAWRRSRDRVDAREVISIGVAVAVQAAVDLTIPEISFAAHASGFGIGLVLGLAWRDRNRG